MRTYYFAINWTGNVCSFCALAPALADVPNSSWELIHIWGSRPAFWLCIGIIGASSLFRVQVNYKVANIWIGSATVALYCGMLIFYFTGNSVNSIVWISKSTGLFIIPGILIGASLTKQV